MALSTFALRLAGARTAGGAAARASPLRRAGATGVCRARDSRASGPLLGREDCSRVRQSARPLPSRKGAVRGIPAPGRGARSLRASAPHVIALQRPNLCREAAMARRAATGRNCRSWLLSRSQPPPPAEGGVVHCGRVGWRIFTQPRRDPDVRGTRTPQVTRTGGRLLQDGSGETVARARTGPEVKGTHRGYRYGVSDRRRSGRFAAVAARARMSAVRSVEVDRQEGKDPLLRCYSPSPTRRIYSLSDLA